MLMHRSLSVETSVDSSTINENFVWPISSIRDCSSEGAITDFIIDAHLVLCKCKFSTYALWRLVEAVQLNLLMISVRWLTLLTLLCWAI